MKKSRLALLKTSMFVAAIATVSTLSYTKASTADYLEPFDNCTSTVHVASGNSGFSSVLFVEGRGPINIGYSMTPSNAALLKHTKENGCAYRETQNMSGFDMVTQYCPTINAVYSGFGKGSETIVNCKTKLSAAVRAIDIP